MWLKISHPETRYINFDLVSEVSISTTYNGEIDCAIVGYSVEAVLAGVPMEVFAAESYVDCKEAVKLLLDSERFRGDRFELVVHKGKVNLVPIHF